MCHFVGQFEKPEKSNCFPCRRVRLTRAGPRLLNELMRTLFLPDFAYIEHHSIISRRPPVYDLARPAAIIAGPTAIPSAVTLARTRP